jgi:adenylate kinase family enzyme
MCGSVLQVIIGLLRAAMVKAGTKNFLIDGFPRALDQAECFEKLVKAPDMVLAFDCPEVGCRFRGFGMVRVYDGSAACRSDRESSARPG